MKFLLILVALINCCHSTPRPDGWDTYDKHKNLITSQASLIYKSCEYSRKDIITDYRKAAYEFAVNTYKRLIPYSSFHFVYSSYSLWLTLAAIAEGTEDRAKAELFDVLRLPEAECARKQIYQFAKTLEPPGEDVSIERQNLLVLDDNARLNGYWDDFVRSHSLMSTMIAPLKADPEGAAELLRKTMSLQLPQPIFDGNSMIVDTLDYKGFWTTAFAEAIVEEAPFYDDFGKKIGHVDLMKMKRRVKMAYLPEMNLRVLDLPVGFGERYTMLIATHIGATQVRSAVSRITDTLLTEVKGLFKESIIPFEVAIPRFRMTTEVDMRRVMEEMGIKSLWTDEQATRNISDPAAWPSSYIQRSTVTFDTTGIKAPLSEVSNIVPRPRNFTTETGLNPILGRDFILDKPFYFGLFDTKTYLTLYSGVFSVPTYKL